MTRPAEYALAGGELKYTLSQGDIYTGDTTPPPNNFLLQDASHAGEDWVIETKINSYTYDGGYAQGGLLAYQDGDNYVKLDAITDVDQHGGEPDRAPLGDRRRHPGARSPTRPSPPRRRPARSGCG